jgi:HTH-type transcriptional regulator / antitoxin HigA
MASRGWIKPHSDRVELLREVLTFFGLAVPGAWNDVWEQARRATALRQGKSPGVNFGVVAVWLRKGEIRGRSLECKPYDQVAFRAALDSLRTLTTVRPEKFCSEIQARCATAGVAVAFVPELPRLKIFGAARWLSPEKALIQLSLYYKREDQLWFSFFHEAAHILFHGRRAIFVDFHAGERDKHENEANRFASDHLIPAAAYAGFVARGHFSESAVQTFAKQVGIAPGIVVGRLQHDEEIGFKNLAYLRRRVGWSAEEDVVCVP